MVLDVLLEHRGPRRIGAHAGSAAPRHGARRRAGKAFGVRGATAVLELEEVMHLTSGEPMQWSCDVFAPGGMDLHVRRALEGASPLPIVNQRTVAGGGAPRSGGAAA